MVMTQMTDDYSNYFTHYITHCYTCIVIHHILFNGKFKGSMTAGFLIKLHFEVEMLDTSTRVMTEQ